MYILRLVLPFSSSGAYCRSFVYLYNWYGAVSVNRNVACGKPGTIDYIYYTIHTSLPLNPLQPASTLWQQPKQERNQYQL